MISLKNFKGIIPTKLLNQYPEYSIKLTNSSINKKCYHFDKPNKTLLIYINNLPTKEKKNLKNDLLKSFNNGEVDFIKDTSQDLLDKLYKYNDKNDNNILAFFKPVLSYFDWGALRDSLFLRNEFKKHNPTAMLKQDIFLRYGERGSTISNLCTAGYFEEIMIPLYKISTNHIEFFEYYGLALDKGITAFFVNKKMTVTKIGDEIRRRLISAQSYGLKYIHIHGIGKKNIINIKKCIDKEKNSLSFTEQKIFNDTSLDVLVVELIL